MEQSVQRGLFTNSKTLRFWTELRAEILMGNIREEVARKAADIILGKTGLEAWSETALDLAKQITWVEEYSVQPKYQDGVKKTPFEKFLERMAAMPN